ncbi:CASP-like protein 4D1 [Cornus florida]|uniref:CASP-like protein 4D1 n=1 Tax=Cornus florida TaxID=4283 RepID=UPI00289B8F90|nr:CASP-like protein 4D1 [Cornus florida]XP_059627746.1 CASP-like protein 4D1 [Cornus florida]
MSESESQPESPPEPQRPPPPLPQPSPLPPVQPRASKTLPIATLVMRSVTLTALLLSLIVIASDSATARVDLIKFTIHFKDFYAYRYMLSTIVIGMAYTLLQIPFAIYHVSMGKRLVKHGGFLHFDFYGDKVLLSLLATGVGAAFGATLDLKKRMDDLEDDFQDYGVTDFSQFRSKADNFFNMANISTGFLLIAFLISGVSSILSSMALFKKR